MRRIQDFVGVGGSRLGRLLVVVALLVTAAGAHAASSHLAAVVVDAQSGQVLHARAANRRLRPASLTKLMTTLVVLDHLQASGASLESTWSVTSHAAGQPAVRLGLRAGREHAAGVILDALLVASANDAAVVAAEAVAGSEPAFAQQMNAAAKRLGLTRTRFVNASGLPASGQYTTARDLAVLARHLWQRFPQERRRFSKTGLNFRGRWVSTTNPLLGSYRGAAGMKTGFTCRAGFNLIGVAERDGRAVIAVVLGAPTRQQRNALVRSLLDRAFSGQTSGRGATLAGLATAPGQGDAVAVQASIVAHPCLGIVGPGRGPTRWNIEVGVSRTRKEARAGARAFIRARRRQLPGARAFSIPRYTGVELHRAIVTGVSQEHARDACLEFRKTGAFCVIFGPEAAQWQLDDAARIRELQARVKAERGGVTEVPRRR